jgi:type I restriction enzyme S subunit
MSEPKLRFPGFADAWEQRKLGELGKCQSGIGFPDREQGGKSGVPFFKVSDMNNLGNEHEMITANNYVSEDQIARMKWKPVEDVPAIFFAKVGAAVMLNRKRLCRNSFLLDNNTMAYKLHDSWNVDFAKAIFETIDLTSLVQIGAFPSYNASDVEEMTIILPMNTAEQQQIGAFFKNLDDLITLHQRKLDDTKLLKQSLLQKMFPKIGEDKPEIRFPGFADAWEQRKLEEYLSVSTDKNVDDTYDKTDVLSVSGDYGIVNQIEFQGRSFAGVSVSNYGVVYPGDVVYTKSPLNSNLYGIIKTNKGKTGIVSTLYAVYHAKENTYPDFVQTYFEQHARMNNYMHPLVNKGAKNDMKVSSENALKGFVIFPKYEEQKRISEYFAVIDNLITLHQRKLDDLKQLKQSLLQQMFI